MGAFGKYLSDRWGGNYGQPIVTPKYEEREAFCETCGLITRQAFKGTGTFGDEMKWYCWNHQGIANYPYRIYLDGKPIYPYITTYNKQNIAQSLPNEYDQLNINDKWVHYKKKTKKN